MITGKDLINEYYEDEKLYSTGDDYLDNLLERAFCEGYEYAQKEFGKLAGSKDKVQKRVKEFFTKTDKTRSKAVRRASDILSGKMGGVPIKTEGKDGTLHTYQPEESLIQHGISSLKNKTSQSIPEVRLLRKGRKINAEENPSMLEGFVNLDRSINSKGGCIESGDCTASGYRVNSIYRGLPKKYFKDNKKTYDHGKSSSEWNKEVMEMRRDKGSHKK